MREEEKAPLEEMENESAGAQAEPEQPQDAPQEGPALEAQLAQATAKAEEYLDMAQRVQADFDNYRRRNESARADAFAEGQRAVASAMLPVLDNLERAVDASATSDGEALRSGVELTLRQLRDTLAKLEVTPIDRAGEPFDPSLENAVLQGSPEEGAPGTVCQVLQKGYMMGKMVLRHAMVKVVPED